VWSVCDVRPSELQWDALGRVVTKAVADAMWAWGLGHRDAELEAQPRRRMQRSPQGLTMTARSFLLRLLGLLALATGCASSTTLPATEVLVVVNSDLKLGVQLTRLQVSVQTEDGSQTVAAPFPIALTQEADAGVGKFALPLSFAITKPSDGTPSFRVLVAGYGPLGLGGSETLVVEQKAIASFQDQRSLRLHVFLGSVCFQKACGAAVGADVICYPTSMNSVPAGSCGPVVAPVLEEVEPTRELDDVLPGLPAIPPSDAGLDAAAPGTAEGGVPLRDAEADPLPEGPSADSGSGAEGDAGEVDSSPVIQLAGAANGTCALRSSGRVVCWGASSPVPAAAGAARPPSTVSSLESVVEIEGGGTIAGGYLCARRRDGTVACWGGNYNGQLGNGTNASTTIPIDVVGLTGATALAAGENHACASKSDGTVYCWGWNQSGQLGNGTATDSYIPVQVVGLSGVVQLAAGYNFTCARKSDGSVTCWGSNVDKQLGFATTYGDVTTTPTASADVMSVVDLVAGNYDACVSKTDGTVTCWGERNLPLTPENASTRDSLPYAVSGLDAVEQVTAGSSHHCARRSDGSVRCWGMNHAGMLGSSGSTTLVPVLVRDLPPVVDIDAGNAHTCGLTADGSVYCWGGRDLYVELGDGSTMGSATPVRVVGL
jgi:Regulator of chromosome condensation (RCC1) repeat